jgi:hypothetical protein
VALAAPDLSGDASVAGTAGPTGTESTGQPRRSAPRTVGSVGTTTKAAQRPVGPPIAAPPTEPSEELDDAAEADDSKLSETKIPDGKPPSGVPLGEQVADPADAADSPAEITDDIPDDVDDIPGEEDDECGWSWWPFQPGSPVPAPDNGDGYGGGAPSATPPVGGPGVPTESAIAPLPASPLVPDPQEPLPGLVVPAAMPVLSMPIIALPPVVPRIGAGGGGAPRGPAGAGTAQAPAAPQDTQAQRPAAPEVFDAAVPASYRAGYAAYLRTAGMPEVLAVAVPGATGIMLLTGAGGLIGYRQARAGRAFRASASRRFAS